MRIANSNFRSTFRNFRKFSKIAANFNKAVVINLWLYREFLQIHVTLHSAIGMQPTSTSSIRSARFRETYKRYFDTISPRYFPNRIERCKIDKRGAARRAPRAAIFPGIAVSFFLDSFVHENAEKCNARLPSDMKYRLVPTIDLLIIDRSRCPRYRRCAENRFWSSQGFLTARRWKFMRRAIFISMHIYSMNFITKLQIYMQRFVNLIVLVTKCQTPNLVLHMHKGEILKICLIIHFVINSDWNIDESIYHLTGCN